MKNLTHQTPKNKCSNGNQSAKMARPAITAEFIAKALGGRRTGENWMACCPAHDDRIPSFSITNGKSGKVLFHCHAGCEPAQVIAALQERGLWEPLDRHPRRHRAFKKRQTVNTAPERGDTRRTESALRIWHASTPAPDTLVETYLQSRGLYITPPPTLRFHSGLKHPSGKTWPTMVALVTRGSDNTPLAIQRTYLARDGSGKAPVKPERMMLGPCHGGAVQLAPTGDVLMVGEGIETCLAAMQATGNPVWSALSAPGLRALDIPDDVHDIIVLADGDDPGEMAARDCALRWQRESRRVRIARPPRGLDFNDMLLGRTPLFVGGSV